jgi:hypothetical protein
MSSNSSPKDKQQIIKMLEDRIDHLEHDMQYLKESGLSLDEQNIVLDKSTPIQKSSSSWFTVALILLNIILLSLGAYFFCFPWENSNGGNEESKKTVIENNIEDFELPRHDSLL